MKANMTLNLTRYIGASRLIARSLALMLDRITVLSNSSKYSLAVPLHLGHEIGKKKHVEEARRTPLVEKVEKP